MTSLSISLFIYFFIIILALLYGIRFIRWILRKAKYILTYNSYENKHYRMRKKIMKADNKRKRKYKDSWKYE